MRLAFLALFALSGCAAVPVAGWVAIGAVAGAVSATAQLDEVVVKAYLAAKGSQPAPSPRPEMITPSPAAIP